MAGNSSKRPAYICGQVHAVTTQDADRDRKMDKAGQNRTDVYSLQEYWKKVWTYMPLCTPTQTQMCRFGKTLSYVLPMYEQKLPDDDGKD